MAAKMVTLSEKTLADLGYIRLYLSEAQKYPNNYENVARARDLLEQVLHAIAESDKVKPTERD